MYVAKFFDPQYGDIDSVMPCGSFDDGVAHVLDRLGRDAEYRIESGRAGNSDYFLKVFSNSRGITLAAVEDIPPPNPVGRHPKRDEIVGACKALVNDEDTLMRLMFSRV